MKPAPKSPQPAAQTLGPTVGVKHDRAKARFDLVPPWAELEMAWVLTHGAEKYGEENWKKLEAPRKRYLAAARRHVNAWMRGEALDPESGRHHLAHAMTSLSFILELELEEKPAPKSPRWKG